ncbi:MAG: isoprenyl transferase [Bacteroidia bacterium]|nr:isoprenyl transferase [Bacteroidia bacterium]
MNPETKKQAIDKQKLPSHIAIIMDGNGRWAKQRGGLRVFGHRSGVQAVRDTIEGAAELGIPFVTLYAFSTENWQRPQYEVDALMELMVTTLEQERDTFINNHVRLRTIGDIKRLPQRCQQELQEVIRLTENNQRMTLTLALSYGSRQDLTQAMQKLAKQVQEGTLQPESIDEQTIRSALSTYFLPDPELLIRTSGEYRISNYLLWEIAYSEIYVTPKLWPDFRREDLYDALLDFQKRERRFGKTSEQLVKT